ncbi:hypothetical protein ACOZ06_004318 [Cronobacter muytjensii]|uniref:Uncharacterized protein n=1 Tax=Cronobacter muytjensii TaxID=413501 RepID=A0A2T7ATE6_9ENTR|nr:MULTISPECIES: hypothetical protein [Cronobacter]EGT4337168.1 hypothetical protein [Cronobacter muytjensii]ELY2496491.1 hypothetical protein [Cronobacter muytjensii]ELY3983134.1 hypothetical protein [Cronobacter muytjensii]ELY4520392.1 hypothetical protein [Cronobacter muytjensii]ELY6224786.1 hypothetical protein [Cronobacter muytjensii]
MKTFLLVVVLALIPRLAYAFAFDNSVLMLRCPGRGSIEVILHRYEHTQEAWGNDEFETGGGHMKRGSLVIFQFANLDRMIYDQMTQSFGFWYAREAQFVHCQLQSIRNAWPVDLPYFHE